MFAVTVFDDRHRAEMATGPWSSSAGSLGVLADSVLGYALIADAPAGLWSVSAEISLDFFRLPPGDGTKLRGEGRTVHATAATGLAEGSIVDQDGGLVARCRQWGRYVRLAGQVPDGRPAVVSPAEGLVDEIRERVSAGEGHAELRVDVGDDLVNPIGTLHGGISLWLAELTAGAAVSRPDLVPASLTATYPRPFPHGDVATFRAEVVSCGRRMAVTRVTGSDRAGKPCVVATVHHQNPH
ncbi:PaaI family thioesterase [Streptomyces sp. NPDC002680]|uniref:PaaI family thioesterase n=1 Tax=Streptomyces sp. NPDC002680 TaxID=3364659 RepID=UPI003691A177